MTPPPERVDALGLVVAAIAVTVVGAAHWVICEVGAFASGVQYTLEEWIGTPPADWHPEL